MSPHDPKQADGECLAIRQVLNRVGDKWSLLVIEQLRDRGQRFSELRRAIEGISQRMLTFALRALERDGIVTRSVFATVPPSVEYSLTPLGRSLREPVCTLVAWAHKNREKIAMARERFDATSRRTGAPAAFARPR